MKARHAALLMLTLALVVAQLAYSVASSHDVRLYGDLDGEGHADSLVVTFASPQGDNYGSYYYGSYKVRIGRSVYDGTGEALRGDATIVDVDRADHRLEIAIPEDGMNGVGAVWLVRYGGGQIYLVGKVQGAKPVIDGSGDIKTLCRGSILCTWFYPCASRWSEEAQVFAEVPQPFVPVNVKVTLKRDLPLCPDPILLRTSLTLKAGTNAVIDLTDDTHWCRIRTVDHASGWFYVDGFARVRIFPETVDAQAVFDGLPMAD